MERKYQVLIITIILVALVGFFYPKSVGGPLCGPVCPVLGLHYYEQSCLGIKVRYTVIDSYNDICYGLPIGEKKCYGVPYTAESGSEDIELDCDYSLQ